MDKYIYLLCSRYMFLGNEPFWELRDIVGNLVARNMSLYPINAERFLQHLLSERLRLSA